ncbi:hypothetical protein, conserved [Babesia ovata]|uniref:Uncharacterized protein n=1 Tax=Babesia ovata TaxID=189622 RepID=A0A2H6KI31_9APIC|nr:uncharacterized protein BOVATA_041380 [Babesia ovata]GBE62645.1 hypothetical protein, conserved [Babesia ovata]
MVFNSLTEAPRNLKESIDWLMALKGTDARKNLEAIGYAIYDFLADKPVGFMELPALEKIKSVAKEFLGQEELKDRFYVSALLKRYTEPMGKNFLLRLKSPWTTHRSDYKNVVNRWGVKPGGIAKNIAQVVSVCDVFLEHIKSPDQYKSAYSSEATWDASCAKKPEDCAVVLVGIAPMLYAGLLFLLDVANPGLLECLLPRNEKEFLRKVMKALGYVEPECCDFLSRSNLLHALHYVDKDVLDSIYDIAGFWAFYGVDKTGVQSAKQSVGTEESAGPEGVAKSVEAEGVDAAEGKGGEAAEQPAGVEEPVIAEEPVKAVKAAKTVKAAKKAAKKLAKKARQKKNPIPDPQ